MIHAKVPIRLLICMSVQTRRTAAERETARRNRRYRALQEMLVEGGFFGDTALRERAPDLYHQHIGRFQSGVITAGSKSPRPVLFPWEGHTPMLRPLL